MADPGGSPTSGVTSDLGPAEVVVNDVRYVREETLFAAMRELDQLREIAGAVLIAARLVDVPFAVAEALSALREVLSHESSAS